MINSTIMGTANGKVLFSMQGLQTIMKEAIYDKTKKSQGHGKKSTQL